MLALKKYIDEHNKNKTKGELIFFIESDNWCKLNSQIVIKIKSDLINYFKKHLFKIRKILDEYALLKNYSIKFNPKAFPGWFCIIGASCSWKDLASS